MDVADRMNRLGTESAFDVFAKAKQLEAEGRSIIHLEIGQPDFPTPFPICEAAFRAMKDGYTGYTPAAGLLAKSSTWTAGTTFWDRWSLQSNVHRYSFLVNREA